MFSSSARAALARRRPAGADGDDALLGFQHVAIPGDDQGVVRIGNRKHGLQAAQDAVSAPVLGEFDGGRGRLPWCFSSLASDRSNSVKASAVPPAKPGQDATVLIEAPDLLAVALMTILPRVT